MPSSLFNTSKAILGCTLGILSAILILYVYRQFYEFTFGQGGQEKIGNIEVSLGAAQDEDRNREVLMDLSKAMNSDTFKSSLYDCLDQLKERIDSSHQDVVKPKDGHEWDMLLMINSSDGIAFVEKATLSPGSEWPSHFDEKAKDCYTKSLVGIKFESSINYNNKEIEWRMCVQPIRNE